MSNAPRSSQRARTVNTPRGPTDWSDSRKRGRRSESPEVLSGKTRDKQTSKKIKQTLLKDQTKITAFSSEIQNNTSVSNTPEKDKTESTNMADNNNTLEPSQFQQLLAEFAKVNTKIDTHTSK